MSFENIAIPQLTFYNSTRKIHSQRKPSQSDVWLHLVNKQPKANILFIILNGVYSYLTLILERLLGIFCILYKPLMI